MDQPELHQATPKLLHGPVFLKLVIKSQRMQSARQLLQCDSSTKGHNVDLQLGLFNVTVTNILLQFDPQTPEGSYHIFIFCIVHMRMIIYRFSFQLCCTHRKKRKSSVRMEITISLCHKLDKFSAMDIFL